MANRNSRSKSEASPTPVVDEVPAPPPAPIIEKDPENHDGDVEAIDKAEIATKIVDKKNGNITTQTMEALRQQREKKQTVRLIIHERDKDFSDVKVQINGHMFLIQRNEEVEVPVDVYKVLVSAKETSYMQVKKQGGEPGFELKSQETSRFPMTVLNLPEGVKVQR